MSGGKKKNKERENYWDAQARQSFAETKKQSPLEAKFEQQQLDFLNWDDSKGKDVRDAPGLDKYIQLADAARNRAGKERTATGALALGEGKGAEGYAAQLQNLYQKEADRDAGEMVENALQLRRSEATGSVLPLASLDQSRRMGSANMAGGMFRTMLHRPRRPSFWGGLLNSIVQGAGAVGSAYAGRPPG